MRISDWSSDVCASDLIVVDCAKAPAGSGRDRDRESSTRRRGRAPRFSSGRTGIGNRPGLVLDAEPEAVAPGAVRPLQSLPAPSRPAGCTVGGEIHAQFEDLRAVAPVFVGRAGWRNRQVGPAAGTGAPGRTIVRPAHRLTTVAGNA